MASEKNSGIIFGLILMGLGVFFLFGFSLGRIISKLWPLALIAIGLYILLKTKKRNRSSDDLSDITGDESGTTSMFGDIRIAGLADGIGAIDRSLVFGDIVIDLTEAKLLDGENNIDVSVFFGDIIIFVPDKFPVNIDLNVYFGDLDFEREHIEGFFPIIKHTDDNYNSAIAKLNIKCRVGFGDIKIHSIVGEKEE